MITGSDEVTPVALRAAAALTHGGEGVGADDGDELEGVGPGDDGAAVPPLHAPSADAVASASATSFGLNLSSGPRECGVAWSTGEWLPAGLT